MDYEGMLKKVKDFMDSKEGQEKLNAYALKILNDEKITAKQLERFHQRYTTPEAFSQIVEKLRTKYDSDSYVRSWYRRGYEPPESLFFFLFDYAKKYGREATQEEFLEYGNMFTSELYYVNRYYFNIMNGQGTVVKVTREIT